jgi:integrase
MALFKRGNVWWAYVTLDGTRHHKSTGSTNRRKAEAVEQQFREELNDARQNLPKAKPDMTFGELSSLFLGEGMGRPHSIERLGLLTPFFADIVLSALDQSVLRRYREYRQREKPKLKPATVNRDLSVLRRIINWGVEEKYLVANPLGRLRMERERRTKRPVLSLREERLLLAAASKHLQLIIICALLTGMRRGEILGQQWEDIDFDNRILHVSHSKTPEGEMREIPLAGVLYELLKADRKENGTVFTFKDDPIVRTKSAWAGALRRSKIRHFRFHDLRHTANTRMMLAGVLQEVRREILGHTSRRSRDVNDRYVQIELPEKRAAIAKLELWLEAQAKLLDAEEQNVNHAAPETAQPQP